jgi:hypothetical protein
VSRDVYVRPEARIDIEQASAWYERQRAGLGDDFLDEVLDALDRIAWDPEIYPVIHAERAAQSSTGSHSASSTVSRTMPSSSSPSCTAAAIRALGSDGLDRGPEVPAPHRVLNAIRN